MKKFTFLLLVGFLSASFTDVFGQKQYGYDKCASDIVLKQNLEKYPELKAQQESLKIFVKNYIQEHPAGNSRDEGLKIIPVVFHVIHECGPENISREQILDQIRIMNEDFSLMSPTLAQTPLCHKVKAANVGYEFRLATKDDEGKCTDGIVRVYSSKTNNASNQNGVKEISHWNSYKYLNIWVVKSIEHVGDIGGVTLGYAQFPFGGLLSTDGLVIRADNIGSIGISNREGRTATHEAGHWFGLRHIWGDAECGSDGVDDTPIAFGPNFGICFDDFPYHIGDDACSGDLADTCGEMFMNFMDYVDDECMSMFTIGQKAIMDGVNASIRSNISSASNLLATGTRDEDMLNPVTCVPLPDFCDNRRGAGAAAIDGVMICEGGSVTFEDVTFNTTSNTREWQFEGGLPLSSTDATEVVNYDVAGIYDVQISSANSAGSNTLLRPDYVRVSPDAAGSGSGPFWEDLNDVSAPLSNFIIFNPDDSQARWEFSPWTGFGDFGSCVRMRNFYNTDGETDDFITRAYDISTITNPSMTFRFSGAERGGTPEDLLRIYTSVNCGQTWILRNTLTGNDLLTAGQFLSEYVPAENDASQWSTEAMSLVGVAVQDNVRFRFQYVAGPQGSNNFYLDDINIGSALSTEEIASTIGLSIYPNPSGSSTKISFSTFEAADITISVFDMLGKKISAVYSGKVSAGEQSFNLDLSGFTNGMYTVKLDMGGNSVYRKFIKG